MNNKHLVFVYGSLMEGLTNHALLLGAEKLGAAETAPEYRMYNLGLYPAIVRGGSIAIKGEVYSVTDEVLAALDRLEGHPDYYKRSKCVSTPWGKASVYMLPEALVVECEQVASGDWFDVVKQF